MNDRQEHTDPQRTDPKSKVAFYFSQQTRTDLLTKSSDGSIADAIRRSLSGAANRSVCSNEIARDSSESRKQIKISIGSEEHDWLQKTAKQTGRTYSEVAIWCSSHIVAPDRSNTSSKERRFSRLGLKPTTEELANLRYIFAINCLNELRAYVVAGSDLPDCVSICASLSRIEDMLFEIKETL